MASLRWRSLRRLWLGSLRLYLAASQVCSIHIVLIAGAMFNLLRYFTVSSLIACIVASLILGVFYRQTAESDLITLAESRNIALFQAIANSLWPQIAPLVTAANKDAPVGAANQWAAVARLRDAMDIQLRGSMVNRLKVYSLNGNTVFSTETAQIGKNETKNPDFQSARSGHLLSTLIQHDTLDTFEGAVQDQDVLSTYIPIYDSERRVSPIAVVEIYTDVSELLQKIDATQQRVVMSLILAFVLLYSVLWLIVRYASGILQSQYAEIQRAEVVLLQEKIVLEQRVAERTTALRNANVLLEHQLHERRLAQEQQRRYGERLEALRQIDQEILAAKSPETIAQAAMHHLRHLIPCRLISMIAFDYETREGIVLAVSSENESLYLSPKIRIPFHAFRMLDEFRPKEYEKIPPDYETTSAEWRLRRDGVARYVQVPLITHDKLVGTLDLGMGPDEELQPEHWEIAHEAANSLAIAVQQARLHEQVAYNAHELQLRVEELNKTQVALELEQKSLAQRVEVRTTELRNANQELAKASRLKDEFLASMSHELRTPLHAILSYAESLQEGIYGLLNERQLRSLHDLEEVGKHLLALINDLLDVSRIEADKLDLEIGQVTIAEICETSLRFIQQGASQKNLQIITNFDQRLTTMAADERRLTQILTNLLNNAVKFTPAGGKIGLDVTADEEFKKVQFVIWDSGIGIEQENLDRIFQPFVQVDARLSRNYSGAGLGLALVERLTKLHQGTVKVVSEAGKGSRFTVSLPLQLLPQSSVAEQGPPLINVDSHVIESSIVTPSDRSLRANEPLFKPVEPILTTNNHDCPPPISAPLVSGNEFRAVNGFLNSHKPLVLVGEDNELNRKTLVDFLEFKGYEVVVAQDGQEAIEITERCNPDLILIDVQMPVLDGLSAIRQLRARGNTKPIIALTGMAMQGDEQRCLSAGATAYYSKPVRLNELVAVLERQLHHRPASKERENGLVTSVATLS